MPITFRKATPSDAPMLKEISAQVIRTNYTSFLGADAVDDFIKSGLADKEIDDGIDSCTVMVNETVILGFAILHDDLLHLIMVDVPYQGSGYGRMLLTKLEDHLFETYPTIHLQTFEDNTNAVQFYLKNNWVITKSEQIPSMNKTMLFFSKCKPFV